MNKNNNGYWALGFIMAALLLMGGCKDDKNSDADAGTDAGTGADTDTGTDTGTGTKADSGTEPGIDPSYTYSCLYENPFSHGQECIEYRGEWAEASAEEHCKTVYSTFGPDDTEFGPDRCDLSGDCVATCIQESDDGLAFVARYYGEATDMEMTEQFCEGEQYGNGAFLPGCDSSGGPGPDKESTIEEEALAAMVSNDEVTVDPECVNDTCEATLAEAGEWITFTPKSATPDTGFVIYPGGSVDSRAYAPAAQAIAKAGILVVIVPMEGGFAPNGYDRIESIATANSSVENWFLNGHSLGGIAAIQYVDENPDTLAGLILWATYGTDQFDASDVSTPVTVIYGELDGLSTVQEIEDGKAYLPADTVYILLKGANHAQFGYYGEQKEDLKPKITRANQQELIVASTLHSISRVLAGGATVHAGFGQAETQADTWCQRAQQTVANVGDDELPLSKTDNELLFSATEFSESSAAISQGLVSVKSLILYGGNAGSLIAPPVYEDEVWCKLKTQDTVVSGLSVTADGNAGTCSLVNQAALTWALDTVSAGERTAYEGSGKQITFIADQAAVSGPDWLANIHMTFEESSTPGTYELSAASLLVGDETSVPEEKRNVFYCKIWTPARALFWVLEQE